MNGLQRHIWLLFLFSVVCLTLRGQSTVAIQAGFLQPFPHIENIAYVSGSADYRGSFSVSASYEEKTSQKIYLGIKAGFQHYLLNTYEQGSFHTSTYTKELTYKFNSLNFVFYPELVFGHRLKYYINAGILFSIPLNARKYGNVTGWHVEETPDGWETVSTEYEVDDNAREDFNNLSAGPHLGTGLRYDLSDNWNLSFDVSGNYIWLFREMDWINGQLDLLISAGVGYTITGKNKP